MAPNNTYWLRDGAIVIAACVVIAALSMSLWQSTRRPRYSGHGTPVRGIQQGFVLYSNSNNGFYPGYDSDGNDDFAAIPASQTKWGCNALTDDDIGKVYALMLTGEFFTADYIISPADDLTPAPWYWPKDDSKVRPTIDNTIYSYALLDMNDVKSNRQSEWRDTNNSQAPIVADPSSDIRAMKTISYHSEVPAIQGNSDVDYEGNIAWNDNHVTFENTGLFDAGTLQMGPDLNKQPLNPFKNKAKDGAKFIW